MEHEIKVKHEEGISALGSPRHSAILPATMSLFVNTDNPNRKLMIVCSRNDTVSKFHHKKFKRIEKVIRIIANSYYSLYLSDPNDFDEEDENFYEDHVSDMIKIESLNFQGFFLPKQGKVS